MAGTLAGGEAAAETNKRLYGKDFYRCIGKAGGSKSVGGGFTGDSERARLTGILGGRTPQSGRRSMARKQRIVEARQALQELNRERGML